MTELRPATQFSALVVEGDPRIRSLLRNQLGRSGYRVDVVADGGRGLARTQTSPYDIILLDLDLPDIDGLTVCRATRGAGPNRTTPIVLLSHTRDEAETVLGLDSGADDYLAKPFGIRELLARVAAIVRRRVWVGAPARNVGLALNRQRRLLMLDGRVIPTTRQEFDLLDYLAARPGAVVTRSALLSNVWQEDSGVTVRTVDAVVCRLRRKIEADPRNPVRLVTAWGIGYTLMEPSLLPGLAAAASMQPLTSH